MTTALFALGLLACGVLTAGVVALLEIILHRRNE